MSKAILAMVALPFASAATAYTEDDVVGTWRLVSAFKKDLETREVSAAYSRPHPVGFLSYGRDHRMMAMAAYDNRIKPAKVDHTTPEIRDQLFQKHTLHMPAHTRSKLPESSQPGF